MAARIPLIVVIAGPNGAGKSTAAPMLLREALAVDRVRERVRLGGHDVAEAVIRRRYVAGLRNFFSLYRQIADEWQMLDNSDDTGSRLIASGRADSLLAILDEHGWNTLMEQAR